MMSAMKPDSATLDSQIATVRRFTRFYTRQIGLLESKLLKSAFSLTEARILYELANRDGVTASELVKDLGLDPGYLSRILKRFEHQGLLSRAPSPQDGRQSVLTITEAGRAAFGPLDRGSVEQVAGMLEALRPEQRRKLTNSMETIERLLGKAPDAAVPYILRSHRPGDMGWIIHRQMVLYNSEYGWDEGYEALISEILGNFLKNFDPKYENAWIAEREGEIVGSVFVVRQSHEVAKLRLLFVEPAARGLGIGRRLVDECIRFSRQRGYKTLTLWTNDVLVSARRIYQAAGFRLVEEEKHHSFGKDLVGQNWELSL
ncbi:DNA-binding MarR family transcriptional regulator [Mesorhizobium sp. J18]|nr:DNA-binding MarR family transcriptional regulator [Mesorhizobium sp. J18]